MTATLSAPCGCKNHHARAGLPVSFQTEICPERAQYHYRRGNSELHISPAVPRLWGNEPGMHLGVSEFYIKKRRQSYFHHDPQLNGNLRASPDRRNYRRGRPVPEQLCFNETGQYHSNESHRPL